jgi:hypothetical protein
MWTNVESERQLEFRFEGAGGRARSGGGNYNTDDQSKKVQRADASLEKAAAAAPRRRWDRRAICCVGCKALLLYMSDSLGAEVRFSCMRHERDNNDVMGRWFDGLGRLREDRHAGQQRTTRSAGPETRYAAVTHL